MLRRLIGKRILVVEDDPITKTNVEYALRFAGATIAELPTDRFDVAVLDLRLGDGETAAPLAAMLASRGIPFMFYTGYPVEAMRHPFPECLILEKPASTAQLLKAVTMIL